MAKARVSINPMYAGGAGGYSFYVRGGEQVVRQRKNNSNYGDTASRSEAQMRRRVKWGNLVNLFKEMKSWQPKAYDGKLQGQTDYNLFMSLNINSSQICLTRDQARNGCAVMDAYQVSRGSIPPITTVALQGGQKARTDIKITSAISATRPIGNLSADIIANNPQFRDGDNIAFIAWSQFVDSRNYPYVVSAYMELTLDTSSDTEVGNLELFNFIDTTVSDYITIFPPGSSFGTYTHVVAIHTRKGASLQVSTQNAVALSSAVADQFKGWEWEKQCIDSYGLNEEVPLDPSFSDGVIEYVTANGSRVSQGQTLTGAQSIRVYGRNLNSGNFSFIADGVAYTPLSQGDGFLEYILTDNVEVTVMLNGLLYMSFSTSGITVPPELSGTVRAWQRNPAGETLPDTVGESTDGCLNYPRRYSEDRPSYRVRVFVTEDISQDTFTVVGGASGEVQYQEATSSIAFDLIPNEGQTGPIYVMYEGFIFFVTNY